MLNDLRIPHLEDRQKYIAERLVLKYWDKATAPAASLDGLEGNLRRYVRAQIAKREALRRRIEYATGEPLPDHQ
jgi:hypothetical protein